MAGPELTRHFAPQLTEGHLMKPKRQSTAWSQASALLCPTVAATAAGWGIFTSFGDLLLSLVLGCVAFIALTPLTATMSAMDAARRRHDT